MEWSSPCLALGAPDIRRNIKKVPRDLGVTLPAGNVEGVPPVLVSQLGVGTIAQQLLDDTQIRASAGHHERSPGQRQEVKCRKFLTIRRFNLQYALLFYFFSI